MAIDLRSDTATRPTPDMRAAIAAADVGDDVFGEDPSVLALEAEVAALVGKEAALFVPSGTMSNQLAIRLHTEPGDDVIVGEGAHVVFYESGAGAALSGVQFATAGAGGTFDAAQMREQIKTSAYYSPRTRLVCVENTHNRAGGKVFPQADVVAIAEAAKSAGLGLHLDGARIWNASVATGLSERELAAPFDTVSVCFSKGLGAPVGSALCTSKEWVVRARRLRKMWGGGMRQAGVLAAAALFALRHHRARLSDDHAHARALAEGLTRIDGLTAPPSGVETNIVNVDVDARFEAEDVCARLAALGVLAHATARRRIRLVTHLDVSAADVPRAVAAFERAMTELAAGAKG
ncbi:MAG: aminotransferase class I/II-fold pyridoxal phosphate-dependent enzyme [Myxococcales bacterium]|nr:aminotransferase class I/II-fold pyridoxal phosphate-dependent enzyme [Myxococcales bacterium]